MALAITLPELVGLIVTEQLDVVAFTVVRLQGDPVNGPGGAVPVLVNATVPPGVLGVPAADVSFTNAVHVTSCPTDTDVGEHDTDVVVVRFVTLTALLTPLLVL